jgi:hypothetical protein
MSVCVLLRLAHVTAGCPYLLEYVEGWVLGSSKSCVSVEVVMQLDLSGYHVTNRISPDDGGTVSEMLAFISILTHLIA